MLFRFESSYFVGEFTLISSPAGTNTWTMHGKDDFMHEFINKSVRSKMCRLITYGNQCEECSTNV